MCFEAGLQGLSESVGMSEGQHVNRSLKHLQQLWRAWEWLAVLGL